MINLDGLYLLVATVTSIPTPYRLSMPRKVVILMLYTYMLSWMPLYVLVEDPFIGSLCLVTVMTGALLWLNHVKHVSLPLQITTSNMWSGQSEPIHTALRAIHR